MVASGKFERISTSVYRLKNSLHESGLCKAPIAGCCYKIMRMLMAYQFESLSKKYIDIGEQYADKFSSLKGLY